MAWLTIARLTLRELGRRRVVLAALSLTLVIVLLTAWGFQRLPTIQCDLRPCTEIEVRVAAAVLLILFMFMHSFITALGAAFLAAPSIAGDIDSGIMLAMLPRPIRRGEVVYGKWLALAGSLTLYTVVVCALEFAIVERFVGYRPPQPIQAIAYIAAESIALLTLAMLGSTRLGPIPSGLTAVFLFGLAWIAGNIGAAGMNFENVTATNVGVVMSLILPTDGLWRGALSHLIPAIMNSPAAEGMNAGIGDASDNFIFTAASPPMAYNLWAIVWIAVVLALAMRSFARREL